MFVRVRCPREDCRAPLLITLTPDEPLDLREVEQKAYEHVTAHNAGPCPDDLSSLTLESP